MKWSVVPVTDEFNDEQNVDPAGLRRQLEKANKELAALRAEKRERTVSDTLNAKGMSPKVAKFIPPDADVDEWLSENADLFAGLAPKADDGERAPQAVEAPQVEAAEPHPAAADFQAAANLVQDSTPRGSESPVIAKLHEAMGQGPEAFAQAAAALINRQATSG